jgi:dihydropyrimidine dehydrogenase (NAD+) subunit PreT
LRLGGIKIHHEKALGQKIQLTTLRQNFDSVFLATGLAGVNALQLEGENLIGVLNAVDYISELRQTKDYAQLPIGKRVVVIGGGNTAIDMAIQATALGAHEVTLVYRRGSADMTATSYEQELAQIHGVQIKYWSRPLVLQGGAKGVTGVVFEQTQKNSRGELEGTGEKYTLPADMVFKAVGQILLPAPLGEGSELLEIDRGKIKVNAQKETSLPGVYAGGDCIAHALDLTVVAVQDGKLAAHAIHEKLTGEKLVPKNSVKTGHSTYPRGKHSHANGGSHG